MQMQKSAKNGLANMLILEDECSRRIKQNDRVKSVEDCEEYPYYQLWALTNDTSDPDRTAFKNSLQYKLSVMSVMSPPTLITGCY